MAQLVKTINSLAIASCKTTQGLAIASAKTILGVDNTGGGGDYLTGIALRYVADDVTGSDGDPIDAWVDSSGNGHDLEAVLTTRPTIQVNEVNGHRAVLFDGSDDEMYLTSTTIAGSAISSATEMTVFAVINQNSATANNAVMKWNDGSDFMEIYASFSDSLYFDHVNFTTGRVSGAQPGGWDDSWHVFECYRNGANMEILVDGSSIASRADASGSFPSGNGTFYIGSVGGGTYFGGYMAEIRVYPSDIGSTNRTTVRDFLATTYGTP